MRKLVFILILFCITSVIVDASEWTGTWACSIYSDSQLNTDFSNATLRQVVRVSIPGNQVRLTFSNLYGTTPLVMQKVHLAQSAGGHAIHTGTGLTVTFGGRESVTIPAGGTVTSDVLSYTLPALSHMAITASRTYRITTFSVRQLPADLIRTSPVLTTTAPIPAASRLAQPMTAWGLPK